MILKTRKACTNGRCDDLTSLICAMQYLGLTFDVAIGFLDTHSKLYCKSEKSCVPFHLLLILTFRRADI